MGEEQEVVAKWKPLNRTERRIVGVLVEKAKTTPNAYPMTLNSLTTGCNQKSNRYPEMSLEPHQVEDALENLRGMGAVAEIAGGGRVPKYRHYMYEWLGVEKEELAVMAELLLRGGQTVGELRSRAARMDPIADLGTLKPILESLVQKGLVISITPEGRGQIVTHALFSEEELAKERSRLASGASASAPAPTSYAESSQVIAADTGELAALRSAVSDLQAEMVKLKSEVAALRANLS